MSAEQMRTALLLKRARMAPPLRRGVHGVEEGKTFRGEVKPHGVELLPQPPSPAVQIPGIPGSLLTLDLLSGQSQQAPLPAPPVRKKARKRNRIAPSQVPGVPPAAQQRPAVGTRLPGLGIQTPEAALVVGDPKGQLRLELGKGAAVCQRLPAGSRCHGKQPAVTVPEKGPALGAVVPPDPPGGPVLRAHRLREGHLRGKHRKSLHSPFPFSGKNFGVQS